jgi:hypothetical protein
MPKGVRGWQMSPSPLILRKLNGYNNDSRLALVEGQNKKLNNDTGVSLNDFSRRLPYGDKTILRNLKNWDYPYPNKGGKPASAVPNRARDSNPFYGSRGKRPP